MVKPRLSEHAADMLKEREISEAWVREALTGPQTRQAMADGTTHYIKPIKDNGGRFLRVVVNETPAPGMIITVFFDRRLGKQE